MAAGTASRAAAHRVARLSPRLVVWSCLLCVPAAVLAGPGGRPDVPMLVLLGALMAVATRAAALDQQVGVERRERLAATLTIATGLVLLAVALRSRMPSGAWLGLFAAAAVGVATIRRARLRAVVQAAIVAAAWVVLATEEPHLWSPAGLVRTLGPVLLVGAIAGSSSAMADDLALARRRELATRRAAERRAELLEAVREVTRAGPGRAVDMTVDVLGSLGFPVAAVLLLDGERLRPFRIEGLAARDDFGGGISDHALRTGRTVVAGDYRNDELRLPDVDLGAVVSTPIPAGERTLGVLTVGLPEAGAPPHGDIEVVEVLAAHLGSALVTDRLVDNQAELLTRLRDLDRLRGGFVDQVSEDLRDPLTVVRGVAQTLATFGDRLPDHQRRELLDRLTAQAGDLSGTLEALLDFSRLQVGRTASRPEPVDVRELFAPLLTRADTDLASGPRTEVVVDRALLERAVQLLRRADPGGRGGLRIVREEDVIRVDVHLQDLGALQGGFLRSLAEQLIVAAGGRTVRLPRGLRLLFPVAPGPGGLA